MPNDKSLLFLPPLKQKLWGNFHDYERALVTTEQEKQCVGETPFSLRIVENIRFCHLFFYFHVVNAVVLLYIIGDNNYFLDSLFLNGYGNIKYGLVQSFNVVVNYSHARTESCLQVVQLEYEETEYLGSTLGLNI